MTNTLDLLHAPDLSVFAPPLQRLILCGGGGLPAAYGPLVRYDGTVFIWNPMAEAALPADGLGADLHPLKIPACFALPLDHWRPRLALVAAVILLPRHRYLAAHIEADQQFVSLTRVRHTDHNRGLGMGDWTWSAQTGSTENAETPLPTLPAHLARHDSHVATLLALMDVPEIRARVEAL